MIWYGMAGGRVAAAAAVSGRGRLSSLASYASGNANSGWISGLFALPAAGTNAAYL